MEAEISKARDFLLNGQLVAIPTETVYGLAGNALSTEAVVKIFEAKNRPFFDPLIVHTHSLESAKQYVNQFPDWAEKLASKFWPGPLTLLLPRHNSIPDIVTNGSDLVAIRVPNHPVALELLRSLPFPLAAPSANPFGYVSPTTAQHVRQQLGDKIAYVLDGGACEVGLESTIVGMQNGVPTVFRTGGISVEEIEATLGQTVGVLQSSSQPKAPGMLESHYAPLKPLLVGDIQTLISENAHKKVGVISFSTSWESAVHKNIILSPRERLNEAAQRLFAALREMDQSEVDIILTEVFPEEGLGRAINDRLRRASVKR
jgi:L-threonylcarbamoyladenylate synthase